MNILTKKKRQAERILNQAAILEPNCTPFYMKLERQCKFKDRLNNYQMNLLKN
jgi:hypothetical protein